MTSYKLNIYMTKVRDEGRLTRVGSLVEEVAGSTAALATVPGTRRDVTVCVVGVEVDVDRLAGLPALLTLVTLQNLTVAHRWRHILKGQNRHSKH